MSEIIGNCIVDGNAAIGFKDEFEEELIVPEGIEIIAEEAFYNYYGLEVISLPKSLKRIDNRAFHNCSNLRKITLPESVDELNTDCLWGCFSGCQQLVEADFSRSRLTVLHKNTFDGCKKLHTVKLPLSLIKIEHGCFDSNPGLVDVIFNEGLKVLAEDFRWCPKFRVLNIPDSVIHIADMSVVNESIQTVILSKVQYEKYKEYLPMNANTIVRDR